MSRRLAIALSGVVWVIIGLMLLYKGLFYFGAIHATQGSQKLAAYLVMGVAIGFFKGRFVFRRTVRRVVDRIAAQSEPVQWKNIYSPGYLSLIGGMMLLGMAMRFIPLPLAFKGTLDFAVGFALLTGSMHYFRFVKAVKEYHE